MFKAMLMTLKITVCKMVGGLEENLVTRLLNLAVFDIGSEFIYC